ncbi:MAG: hypothetical protein J5I93_14355 [Pirellulaceae bacterium]|nr:hypothetical protein [Pirellulaceae bacterium]
MTNPTSDLDPYVNAKIASGEFRSREEFFVETARLYRELEARHADLKSLIRERVEEADRDGLEPLDIDAIKAKLAQEIDLNGQSK